MPDNMNLKQLMEWRDRFGEVDGTPQMKVVASQFKAKLRNYDVKGWEVYELLRGDNFGLIVTLLEKANA